MADIFDGIRMMDEESLRRTIATMEEVTVSGGVDEFRQKAYKGTVKFINGFIKAFDTKLIDEPVVSSREDRINSKLKELSRLPREQLEKRLKNVLTEKAIEARLLQGGKPATNDRLYAAVVEGALRYVQSSSLASIDKNVHKHSTVASKAEYIYELQKAKDENGKDNKSSKKRTLSAPSQASGTIPGANTHHDYYVGEGGVAASADAANSGKTAKGKDSLDKKKEMYFTGESESILSSSAGMLSLAMNKDNLTYCHFAGFIAECGKLLEGDFQPKKEAMPSFMPGDTGFMASRNHEQVRKQLKKYKEIDNLFTYYDQEIAKMSERIVSYKERISDIDGELKEYKSKIISLKREVRLRDKGTRIAKDNLAESLNKINNEIVMTDDVIKAYEDAKRGYDKSNAAVASRNKAIEEYLGKISALTKQQEEYAAQIDILSARIEEYTGKKNETAQLLKSENEVRMKNAYFEIKRLSDRWIGNFYRLGFRDGLFEEVISEFSYEEYPYIESALAELNRAGDPIGLSAGSSKYEFEISNNSYGSIVIEIQDNRCIITSIEKVVM